MGLYGLKPASQRLLRPVEDRLVAVDVSPDAISAAAIIVAALGGACLALGGQVPALLLLVPLAAAVRLALNILDGAIARRTGAARPVGELWNEVGDRVADVLFLGGLAFHPAVDPRLALGATIAALLASYVGIASRAAGGRRQYTGILSKPGRMVVLGIAAPLAFIGGDGRVLAVAAAITFVGSAVTFLQRVVAARAELAGG